MPARPFWLTVAPVVFLLLWAAGYTVAKVGLDYAEPMTLLCLRYGLVVAIMAVAFAIVRPPLPVRAADWGHLALVGFLIQSVYFGLTYLSFRQGVAAGTAALLMSLQPVLVALIAPRWSGERIGWRRWAGLALGLAGAGTVIAARSAIEAPSPTGFALAGLGLCGITAAALWEKRFGTTHHPITANLIGYGAGLIGVVPAMLMLETMRIDWTWEFGAVLFYLVIGNSVIAVGLLLAMIRAGEVAKVSALFFLVPPLAALFGWVALGEIMPPVAWAGMAVAACGVLLATRKEPVRAG